MKSELRQRDALLEAGMALSSELSLDAILQRLVELAVQITGARYGALGVVGPEGGIAEFVTTGISEEERRAIGHLPVGRGLLGVLLKEPRTLRLEEISKDPRSVGFPPNHPPMHSFLGAPVKARGRVFGNIYLTEKQGAAEFSEEDEEAIEVLAAQAGVAVENARLYDEARQQARRLEAVRESATAILAGIDPQQVLELVARRARELVGADLATIAVPSGPGSLALQVADGLGAEGVEGLSFSIGQSMPGDAIQSGDPIVLEDASTDPRAYLPMITAGEIGPAMFVPLQVRGNTFGTLAVANHRGGRVFSDDDLALVQTFAGQASVAIEYGRAQEQLQRMAIMEDRERIAKELHDGVIQSLFAMGMGLQSTAMISKDREIERRIENAVSEMDQVIRDLRNYIFGLRPGILADRQLDQALRNLAEGFQEQSGITTATDIDPRVAAELSSLAADAVQFVREALSNVGRHSGAVTCRVSLRRGEGRTILEVDDDGGGFDIDEAAGKGQGLANLRDRANALGGDLDIRSVLGEGTTVRAAIPV